MKSNFYSLLALACMIISCADFSENVTNDSNPENGMVTEFSATYEFHDSRTVIDDETGHLSWQKGDLISIFSAESFSPTCFETASNEDTATFKGQIAKSATYVGLYPYDPNSSFNLSSSSVSTTLNINQKAVVGSFDPSCFLTVGLADNQQIDFRNVCGGVRFSVSTPGITKVVFRSLEKGSALAGTVSIKVSNTEVPVATVTANRSDSVVVSCPEGFETGKHYYITTLPILLNQGFEFIFYKENTKWTSTVCYQPVEIKRSVFSTVNNADDQNSIDKIKVPVDLSVDETANCYVVSSPGYYKFLPTKGNTSKVFSGIDKVGLVWETANTSGPISEHDILSNVSFINGYIYFETPAELMDGNALIAAYNGNNVLWSWHIWCCKDFDPDETAQRYKEFDRSTYLDNKVMMDRNLGALSNSPSSPLSNGLMYQWGRKDPFMGAANRGRNDFTLMKSTHPAQTVNNWEMATSDVYATLNPNTFICARSDSESGDWKDTRDNNLWTEYTRKKSQYDPCPPGWRVPMGGRDTDYNPWAISAVNENGIEQYEFDKVNYGLYIDLDNGGKAWYPCNGYLSGETKELKMPAETAYYWCATPESSGTYVFAFRMFLKFSQDTFKAKSDEPGKRRSEGHSVRCIKDI